MTLFDDAWGLAILPFAAAAILSPFAAYIQAKWRRRHS
mgnify:CR=1 FL=1